ncbi:E3 ubiquitin-protein ligase BRE1B-like [Platysternon megacephalum]|uniref:E3 ubiquitin-protein ligase BRE1B-like n=1 Tax=Platysternon megacephalum TaxID=55544 RepID=A0A4D9EF66_9SAUR|nr:E3 ubiquitin-protein ligase BRE1B-like [Platysternon megacephalum]
MATKMARGSLLVTFLLLMCSIYSSWSVSFSVFMRKEEAHQVLKIRKRANQFLEEIHPGNLERECTEETCSFEEAKEIFQSQEKTMEFWFVYKDLNPCKENPCKNGGVCKLKHYDYFCICPPLFGGKQCEIEKFECWYKNGGCWQYCQDTAHSLRVVCSCAEGYALGDDAKRCTQSAQFPCGLIKRSMRALDEVAPGLNGMAEGGAPRLNGKVKRGAPGLNESVEGGTPGLNWMAEGGAAPRLNESADGGTPGLNESAEGETPRLNESADRGTPGLNESAEGETPGLNGSAEGGTPGLNESAGGETPRINESAEGETHRLNESADGGTPGLNESAEGETPRLNESAEGETPRLNESADGGTPGLNESAEGETPRLNASAEGETPRLNESADRGTPELNESAEGETPGLNAHDDTRITGGSFCHRGHCPWQVFIRNSRGYGFCGGSLISSRWVVTAAHCLEIVKPHHVTVGDFDKHQREVKEQKIEVQQSWIHPHYDSENYNGDIALLYLSSDVVFNEYALPICLPNPNLATLLTAEGTMGMERPSTLGAVDKWKKVQGRATAQSAILNFNPSPCGVADCMKQIALKYWQKTHASTTGEKS